MTTRGEPRLAVERATFVGSPRGAEDVDPEEIFELVTIGNAFHRLPRRRIAGLAAGWLRRGGHLALLWGSTPMNNGTARWQHTFAEAVLDWTERVCEPPIVSPQTSSTTSRSIRT